MLKLTRAMSKKASQELLDEDKPIESVNKSQEGGDLTYDLEDTFLTPLYDEGGEETPSQSENNNDSLHDPLSHDKLILEQENDPELRDFEPDDRWAYTREPISKEERKRMIGKVLEEAIRKSTET